MFSTRIRLFRCEQILPIRTTPTTAPIGLRNYIFEFRDVDTIKKDIDGFIGTDCKKRHVCIFPNISGVVGSYLDLSYATRVTKQNV